MPVPLGRWLLLAVLLGGCASRAPCRVELATRVRLIFLPGDARVEIPAAIDRQPARLLLDTGADATVLTDAAFQHLAGLERVDHSRLLAGVGGSQLVGGADLWRFSLGVLASQLPVAVLDHSILPPIPPMDGLLGLDAIAGYDLDFDTAGGFFGLYRATGGCDAPVTALTGRTRTVKLLPVTPGITKPRFRVTIHGHELIAGLDTGAPTTVLFAGVARRLGYHPDRMARHPTYGIGGQTFASGIVLDRIHVGPFNMHDMPATILDEAAPDRVDLLLGMDFARYLHVWLSMSSNTLVLQYPPLPTPDEGGGASGAGRPGEEPLPPSHPVDQTE